LLRNNNGKHKHEEQVDTEQTEEKPLFGVPYENTRKHSKFDFGEDLVVVPVEIEIDSMLYNLIQSDILTHFMLVMECHFKNGSTFVFEKGWSK
jgi:hypothetical protein